MNARAYYNENEPYVAQWIRNLIADGHVAPGDVDERSIVDVRPGDLVGYTQCHFFAGIAGWSYAARLAGWPDERPLWTGSCPCQPFSQAGKKKGFADPRHLWPQFRRLIAEFRPAVVFGEQVAGASGWLRLVRSDLEEMGYAVGAMPIEAASARADHFRDRYWFVADLPSERGDWGHQKTPTAGGIGAAESHRSRPMANPAGTGRCQGEPHAFNGAGEASNLGIGTGDEHRPLVDPTSLGWGEGWTESEFRSRGFAAAVASIDGCQYLECPDGKWRRLPPPRVRWLGTRLPARVDRLRAFGNAIDPRPASQFIAAYMDCAPWSPSPSPVGDR